MNMFEFASLIEPQPVNTPEWVLPYAPPFKNGTITPQFSALQSWVEFGVTGQLYVSYVPSQYLHGLDSVSFTIYDHPTDGSPALPASTAPYEFRFHIKDINNPPFALDTVFKVDSITAQQGKAYLGRLRYYDVESPHTNLSIVLTGNVDFFNLSLYLATHSGSVFNATTNCSEGDPVCAEALVILEKELSGKLINPANASVSNSSNSTNSTAPIPAYSYRITTSHGTVTLLPPGTAPAHDASANAVMFLYQPNSGAYAAQDTFTFQVWDGTNMSSLAVVTIVGGSSGSSFCKP